MSPLTSFKLDFTLLLIFKSRSLNGVESQLDMDTYTLEARDRSFELATIAWINRLLFLTLLSVGEPRA